jgi:hypothetical protein
MSPEHTAPRHGEVHLQRLLDFTRTDEAGLPASVQLAHGWPDGGVCGELRGPLLLENLSDPWSGTSLQLTLFRPETHTGAESIVGGLVAEDAISLTSAERQYGDCISMSRRLLLPPGLTHLIFDIAPMRTTQGNRDFDFTRIRTLTLNLGGTPDSPVYVRHLRLCDERDTVGTPVVPCPGDTITHLQHQDITCYTFGLADAPRAADVTELQDSLRAQMASLRQQIDLARLGGRQTLYAEAGLLVAQIALEARDRYPWTRHLTQRRRDLTEAHESVKRHQQSLDRYVRGLDHEDDEDDSNIPVPRVPPAADLAQLRIEGDAFVDADGLPALLYSMNYHDDGELCRYFAPHDHRVESFAVGGGSRYDIEWSPVYRVFHQEPAARRVGYRGWCGHLIKDQWAMGGRKENVLICLESEAIRQAVSQYNREHAQEWCNNPNLLYNILAYELMYICYCDESARMFRNWLRQRHADIDALNDAWGTQLTDFDSAPLPQASTGVPEAATSRGQWFDWVTWNTRRFTDILRWSRDDVRSLHAAVPLCAGGTSSMLSPGNGNSGIDEEMIIEEVDDVILHEGSNLLSLDLLRSLSDHPKPVVDPEHGGDAYQMLQGFLHGKSTISKFWWPKQPSRQFPHMTLAAPMQGTVPITEVEEHFRVALDVRRLGREISLFWHVPAQIAIHYSKSSILQVPFELLTTRSTPYLQALKLSYDAARRLDTPVGFLSERQLVAGTAAAHKLVVLPAVRYMPPAVVDAIDGYVRAGGTLLILPEALQADEYARPQPYLDRWGIDIGASHVPQIEGLGPSEQGYDQSLSQKVHFGPGRELQGTCIDDEWLSGCRVETSGIFQEIDVSDGRVLAAADGIPLLVHTQIDEGQLYYFAGMPTAVSLRSILDRLMSATGVTRSLRLGAPDGTRLDSVEARLVSTKYYDLIYLVNEADTACPFRLETQRPWVRARELRSLEYWNEQQGALLGTLPARQTLIFKLSIDPVAVGRDPDEPVFAYHGM